MSWKAEYVILIMLSTITDYIAGLQIYKAKNLSRKKLFLGLSLLINLGLLFIFKYFNFFSQATADFLKLFSIPFSPMTLKVLLPVGISFYTFQTLSYTIDIYRGKIKPEKHLGVFAVYVSFFPQLVAGPIERAKNLLPQFFKKHHFEYKRVTIGLKIMLWGFFLKLVVADRAAIVVNQVYNNVFEYTGASLILATVFFAAQVYGDFAGYSFIAIGAAKVMGFRLMENFRRPYFSQSIAEFWRRWHISLSTWFQDYVFTPLYFKISKLKIIKNTKPKIKHTFSFCVSILIGLGLLGLWHGAAWKFIFFGIYNGLLISLYHLMQQQWNKLNRYLQIGFTFCFVIFGLILFRANSLSESLYILTNLFSNISGSIFNIITGYSRINRISLFISFTTILFMISIHVLQENINILQFISKRSIWLRWSIYFFVIFLIVIFGVFNQTPFIYFQF